MGHEIVPSQDPSSFVELPWNSWTFERTNLTVGADQGASIVVSDILGQLKSRIGLSDTAVLRIKLQSARIWCTAAGPAFSHPDLRGIFYEVNGQTNIAARRSTQRDIGTLNVPARVGYVYPIDDKKEILSSPDGSKVVLNYVAAGDGSEVTVRIQLLWQSSGI